MNGTTQEKLIRLCDVTKLPWLPERPGGKRLGLATIYRWSSKGVRGTKLRTLNAGGSRVTTESWLVEFFERLSPAVQTDTTRTPTQRNRDRARAAAVLDSAGI